LHTLALFDIDGTLIHTLGAGIRGMNAAFARLYGIEAALDGVPISGRTDRAIVTDAFRKIGVEPTDAAIWALRDTYFAELPGELNRLRGEHVGILPGVVALVDRLRDRPDTTVALLTGNFIGGAHIKLSFFDLWRRFAFGAFGDDHLDRRDLVPVALARAAEAGISPSHVVVIGDTPLDIDCAHAHGAFALAVATGPYTVAQLNEAGADIAVPTLETVGADLAQLSRRRTSAARGPFGDSSTANSTR